MKRNMLAPLIAICVILLGLSVGSFFFTPDRAFSENENRYLQTTPELTADNVLSGKFMTEVENYTSDQILLRDFWTGARSALQRLEGRQDISGTYLGADGRYFAKVTDDTFNWDNYQKNLAAVETFFAANDGKRCTALIVPSPAGVLRDSLPERCGKDWDPFHAAEFSLSEDEAGKAPFFHFDFHNLSALHQTIRDGEFVEPDTPDHPHFLEQARRLRSGEQDWFVGALYYPLFSPEMHFCNASVRSGVPLTQLLSPSVPPYYGVIFLREERPLTPEVLTHWAETLSQPLFGQPFSCTLAQVPSRQEAMEQFENEMRLTR